MRSIQNLQQLVCFPGNFRFPGLVATGAQQAVKTVAQAVVLSDPDIVQYRHVVPQTNILERALPPERSDPVRLESCGGLPVDTNISGSWLVETTDNIEHRRLAGAVGSDQPNDLTLIQVEVKIRQGLQAAKTLAQTVYFKHWTRVGHGMRGGSFEVVEPSQS